MPVSGLLNIAWEAITSNQIAINVTGANIANVNTPGYTRQRADFKAIGNVDLSAGQAGFGVRVDNIKRLYNSYLEAQILDQTQRMGYDAARQEMLGRVEGVFNESSSGGLSDALNQFWNSWEGLSSDPNNQVARYSVVSAASNLASLFRENSNVLRTMQFDIQDSMASTVTDINSLTAKIADLNERILATGTADGSANNLIDSRMELLKDLADKINISYNENNDGTLNVFLANGSSLVGGNTSKQLDVTKDSTGNTDIVFKNNPSTVLNDVITGGRLGAMIDMGETTVAGYSDRLDRLADGIVKAVNDLHTVGWNAADISHIDSVIAPAGNTYPGSVAAGGTFTGDVSKTYVMKITAAGAYGAAKYKISTDGGQSWGAETLTDLLDLGVISLGDGVTLTFADFADPLKLFAIDDIFTVNAYPSPYFQGIIDAPISAEGHVNLYAGDVASGGDFRGDVNNAYALQITTGGAFGVAKYKISTDGGQTWGAETLTDPADLGVFSLGDGVALTFADFADATKPLVKDDVFYVNAYPPPYYKGNGEVFFDDGLTGAKNMRVSAAILADPQKIVASVTGNDGFIDGPKVPTAAEGPLNAYAGAVISSGAFTGDVNMAYAMRITTGGVFGVAEYQLSNDGGQTWGAVTATLPLPDGRVVSLGDGVSLTFDAINPLVAGDTFYVNAYPPADFLNARLLGAVKDNLYMDGGASTFIEYYATLVGQVGVDVRGVDGSIARNTSVTNQLTARRDSVSGVSLDEEVINLMKYQFGYNTAGKLAQAANELLDVLMALGK